MEAKETYVRYLKQVLGVQNILRSEVAPSAVQLLVLVSAPSREESELLKRMIQAMKLEMSQVSISEEVALRSIPAVCFGLESWTRLQARYSGLVDFTEALGTWQSALDGVVLATHSLTEVGLQPQLKKVVWQHLQEVMKRL